MRLWSRWPTVTVALVALVAALRCGSDTGSGMVPTGAFNDRGAESDEAQGIGGGGVTGVDAGIPEPAPEIEAESTYRSPVTTGPYIWTANPDSGYVALIDARNRSVRTVEAGHAPTYLAAIPAADGSEHNRALVLNRVSQDATLLSLDQAGELAEPVFIDDVHGGANSLAVSSRGRFVLAWTDSSQLANPDPLEGFHEVTVIDLGTESPRATRLSVAYRPSRVFISQDETRAFVVTQPGISVIELGRDVHVSRDIALSDEPLPNDWGRDVSVTPDGSYALVRFEAPGMELPIESEIGVVSLETGDRVSVIFSGPVTDLDLTEDGSLALAVVSARYVPIPPTGQGGAAGSAPAAGGAAAAAGGAAGASGKAGSAAAAAAGAGPMAGASGAAGGPAGGGAGGASGAAVVASGAAGLAGAASGAAGLAGGPAGAAGAVAGASGGLGLGGSGVALTGGSGGQLTGGSGGQLTGGSGGSLSGGTLSGGSGGAGGSGGSPPIQYERLPSELVLLPIPDIFAAPDRFVRVVVGEQMVRSVSVSAQSSYAVLFSTAAGSEDRDHVTIINVDPSSFGYLSYRTQALRETFVESVLLAPDDSYAIAVLMPGAQSQVAGAFAVIPVSEDLAVRLEPTRAPPVAVALGPSPTRMGVVTTSSPAGQWSYFVRLPDPVIDEVTLPSRPLATGIVSTADIEVAYVAQSHPEGRLTFIAPDPESQAVSVHDLTGFEQGRLTEVGR